MSSWIGALVVLLKVVKHSLIYDITFSWRNIKEHYLFHIICKPNQNPPPPPIFNMPVYFQESCNFLHFKYNTRVKQGEHSRNHMRAISRNVSISPVWSIEGISVVNNRTSSPRHFVYRSMASESRVLTRDADTMRQSNIT